MLTTGWILYITIFSVICFIVLLAFARQYTAYDTLDVVTVVFLFNVIVCLFNEVVLVGYRVFASDVSFDLPIGQVFLIPLGAALVGFILGWNLDGIASIIRTLYRRRFPECYRTKNGFDTDVMRDKDLRFLEGRLVGFAPYTFSNGDVCNIYGLRTKYDHIKLESIDERCFDNEDLYKSVWAVVDKSRSGTGLYNVVAAGVDEGDLKYNHLPFDIRITI